MFSKNEPLSVYQLSHPLCSINQSICDSNDSSKLWLIAQEWRALTQSKQPKSFTLLISFTNCFHMLHTHQKCLHTWISFILKRSQKVMINNVETATLFECRLYIICSYSVHNFLICTSISFKFTVHIALSLAFLNP